MAAEEQERIHIPLEIVEEILVSLPVKSLLRFSTVSKSWNSLIFHSRFIKSHKWRGVSLQRRQQIPTTSSSCNSSRFLAINDDGGGSLSPISVECISPTPPTPDTKIKLRSHCHELWCVKFKDTIFLWNPSMRTHRKIPNPAHIISPATAHYGLAYHSSTDDYNILYCDTTWDHDDLQSAELYSLRNNSWKKIHPNLPLQGSWYLRSFDSGFGALHFMLYPASWSDGRKPTIVCFDLSTEMYAEVAAPPYTPAPTSVDGAEVRVIREKLCVYVNYVMTSKFDLWVMQEYGDGKSWSKMFEIDCGRFVPYARIRGEGRRKKIVAMALHFDDDGRKIIVKVESWRDDESVIMEVQKDKERLIFRGSSKEHIFDFLYVETLISPATHGGAGGESNPNFSRPPKAAPAANLIKVYFLVLNDYLL